MLKKMHIKLFIQRRKLLFGVLVSVFMIIATFIIIFINYSHSIHTENSDLEYISNQIDLPSIKGEIIDSSSTIGFHGDGIKYVAIKVEEDFQLDYGNQLQEWDELPMYEDLDILCYGGTKGGTAFAYEYLSKAGIPKLENGYYRFINYNDDPESLLYGDLRDFCMVLYDTENQIMYYYEFHS